MSRIGMRMSEGTGAATRSGEQVSFLWDDDGHDNSLAAFTGVR